MKTLGYISAFIGGAIAGLSLIHIFYVFQVVNKAMRAGVQYNEAKQMQMCMQQNMQAASGFMQDLVLNAKVVDNRYLFF